MQIYQCRRCCKIIRRKDCPKEKHVCNLNHCPSCKKMVQTDNHKCFLNKIAPKAPNSKFIFFDLETDQSTGEHIVNFAVSQKDDGTENIFSGYTALHEFCSFLFVPKHKNYTVIAHNLQGFDGQFILGWLLEQGLKPTVIPNGSKFLSIKVKALNISFIDSFSFLPMPLSRLPESFGIKELCKGYFPHLFNRPENQNYCGPIPDSKFYAPESMSEENRNFFLSGMMNKRILTLTSKKKCLCIAGTLCF